MYRAVVKPIWTYGACNSSHEEVVGSKIQENHQQCPKTRGFYIMHSSGKNIHDSEMNVRSTIQSEFTQSLAYAGDIDIIETIFRDKQSPFKGSLGCTLMKASWNTWWQYQHQNIQYQRSIKINGDRQASIEIFSYLGPKIRANNSYDYNQPSLFQFTKTAPLSP